MKLKAIIQDGLPQIGGFQNVETQADRYVCDGVEYPFVILTEGHRIGDYTDTPPMPAPVVPVAVTMRQARLALLQAGKLSAVNAAIAGMSGAQGEAAKIEWEFSNEVQRAQPLVAALAPVLGMTSAQLDQLFITAAGL